MNPIVKQKWVEALRSGKYKQTQAKLHSVEDNKYCCLGVLCDIAVQEGVILPPTVSDNLYRYDEACFSLPEKVCGWADINNIANYGSHYTNLAYDNDHGLSFFLIADIIEEHL